MSKIKKIKGYKVTDKNLQCSGFQYELNKTFTHEGGIVACKSGFHFCKKLTNCFDHYLFNPNNRVFEVEAWGKIVNDKDKMVAENIRLIRELTWHEVIDLVNSGYRNSGYRNSGDWNSGNRNSGNGNSGNRNSGKWNLGDRNSGNGNSGYWNSGDWNSGDWNSGNWNSGDWNSGYRNSGDWNSGNWNSGDRNSGYLNTNSPKVRIFNKETDIPLEDIVFPEWMYFNLTVFVESDKMTKTEKISNPNWEMKGGYWKTLDYKEAAQISYNKASKDDQDLVEQLPNYDAEILFEIFGIDRRKLKL